MAPSTGDINEWVENVDEVTAQIRGIIDGTITDFEAFDREVNLKERAKQIRDEEARAKRERIILYGFEGKGEGQNYKWWCKRCFVEYTVDLPENSCTRCKKSDQMMTQAQRREELMGKLEVFKEEKAKHHFRKDKWLRWKKSQALLKRSKYINYKAWEFWEPDTDTEDEGEPIVPRSNPEFLAMEADMKARKTKYVERSKTAEKCQQRGNQCMKEGDFVGAIENYEEGLEYRRDSKALWTNKALAEVKIFRWHDAIASCNKVIEYAEIFEDGFKKSADACFKAFTRRAVALRALHRWEEALADLDDALSLFPKDREAKDLHEKTKAALDENRELEQRSRGQDATPAASPVASGDCPAAETGPVRVAIEESDEEEEVPPPTSQAFSLAGLSKQAYGALLAKLKKDKLERQRFCTRAGVSGPGQAGKKAREDRKIDISVEEVAEPSRLDGVVKDAERCSVLLKRSRGQVVPLRDDVRQLEAEQCPEEVASAKSDAALLDELAPRVLEVLHVLASQSDHHAELAAMAMRHVWPLLGCASRRRAVLELLLEFSQRTVSAKAMADFASRYPDPHLRLLVDAVTEEAKENVLPAGLQEKLQASAKRIESGEQGLESALEDVLQGLSAPSPAELAVSTLGNICLAGQAVPAFRTQLEPFSAALAAALRRHLRPLDWRLCGRAAGAICNAVRLGAGLAEALEEQCLEALVVALREGRAAGQGVVEAMGRLLGALANLVTVRSGAGQRAQELGALDLAVPLITANAAKDSEEALRACQLVSRIVGARPSALPAALEADLLRRLQCILESKHGLNSASDSAKEAQPLEAVDLSVRLVTLILTQTPGALDRFIEAGPAEDASASFRRMASTLTRLVQAVRPTAYLGPDEEGGPLSRLRGNLALLFASICDLQVTESAQPALRELNLQPLVEVFLDCLRKERGKAQHNIGVCVTRMAHSPRYKERVRELNGIQTLHQVQLPKVEVQKAEAMRQHRLRTLKGLD